MLKVNDIVAPRTGDVLSAHKPIKTQKEVHGEGFKDIFNKAMDKERSKQNWGSGAKAEPMPKSHLASTYTRL